MSGKQRHDRRRRQVLRGGAALLAGAALGVGAQPAATALWTSTGWQATPADRATGVRDTTTTGEPYDLAGRRIVFTSWQFIRPGTFDYVDRAGRVVGVDDQAAAGEATIRRTDMPFGISLVAQQAQRLGPILQRERPWEKLGVNFWSMFQDGGIYRAWGSCAPAPGDLRFCYFESQDGLTWSRPDLGLADFAGSTQTNLLSIPVGSVFKDPAAPPDERYKWVSLQAITDAQFAAYRANRPDAVDPRAVRSDTNAVLAIVGAVSQDGLHWSMLPDPLVVEHSDTQIVGYFDSQTSKYVLYTRNWMVSPTSAKLAEPGQGAWLASGRRSIGRTESADFRHFPLSEVIVDPPLNAQPTDVVYSNARTTIPGAPDHHLMFPAIWHTAEDTMSLALASSYNGKNWNWLLGSPILQTGEPGAWDASVIFGHPDLTELADGRFVLPYTGYRLPHKYPRVESEFGAGYAVWPDGRIVAVDAPEQGELTTVGFFPPTRRLRLNVRTREGGSVRVEAAELNGRPLEGRAFADATPIVGDDAGFRVRWRGRDTLGGADNQPVILRFRLQNAELFGIDFA